MILHYRNEQPIEGGHISMYANDTTLSLEIKTFNDIRDDIIPEL